MMMLKRTTILTIMAVFLVMGAVAVSIYSTTGRTDAAPLASAHITFTELTNDEWKAAHPVAQASDSAESASSNTSEFADELTDGNFAGIKVSWTFTDSGDIQTYRVERRVIEPVGSPVAEWQLLEDSWIKTFYNDAYGAPGFEYQYRITGRTLSEEREHVTAPRELIPRRGFWGRPIGGTGIQITIQKLAEWDDRPYRISRYDSPKSTDPDHTEVTLRTNPLVGNLTTGKVYKFVLEQGTVSNDDFTDPVQRAVSYVKTGQPTLTAPGAISVVGTAGHDGEVGWNRLSNVAPGHVAFYEILRRDAKSYGDEFKIVGTGVLPGASESLASSGEHFEYQVRAVTWPHVHGPTSDSKIEPEIEAPICQTQYGESVTASGLNLMESKKYVPLNPRYGFLTWMDGSNEQGRTVECTSFDTDDWYVLRNPTIIHKEYDECPGTTSCTLIFPSHTRWAPKDAELASGTFVSTPGLPNLPKRMFWYDAPEAEPGVYQYKYKVCSYYSPAICSGPIKGDWQFHGIGQIPFTSEAIQPEPASNPVP